MNGYSGHDTSGIVAGEREIGRDRGVERAVVDARKFEVVVVGGGPAGAAMALALTNVGRRVAVLERSARRPAGIGEALPPETRLLLEELGLWERFIGSEPAASPGTLSAWGDPGLVEADHLLNPFGCGWHVDRADFDAMLSLAVGEAGCPRLRLDRPARIVCRSSGLWSVEVTVSGESRRLFTSLIVDATGRASVLARRLGACRVVDDRMIGLVACWPDPGSGFGDERRTLVESAENGWWYSVRLRDGRIMAAFMTGADLFPQGRGPCARFLGEELLLAPHTALRLGGADSAVRFRARMAESSRLDRPCGEGWVAVGDAASAWDPLSSQGVYRALMTGLDAAYAAEGFLRGDRGSFNAYAGRIRTDHRDYLEMRAAYYGLERRWRDAPFWRGRRAAWAGERGEKTY